MLNCCGRLSIPQIHNVHDLSNKWLDLSRTSYNDCLEVVISDDCLFGGGERFEIRSQSKWNKKATSRAEGWQKNGRYRRLQLWTWIFVISLLRTDLTRSQIPVRQKVSKVCGPTYAWIRAKASVRVFNLHTHCVLAYAYANQWHHRNQSSVKRSLIKRNVFARSGGNLCRLLVRCVACVERRLLCRWAVYSYNCDSKKWSRILSAERINRWWSFTDVLLSVRILIDFTIMPAFKRDASVYEII